MDWYFSQWIASSNHDWCYVYKSWVIDLIRFVSLALVNCFLTYIVVFVAKLCRAWINHRAHRERIFTHAWESPIMNESTLNANESRNRRDAIWFAAASWLHLIKANEYCLIDNNNAFAKLFLSFRFWLWYDFQYPNMGKHKNELWINWVDHELFNIIFSSKAHENPPQLLQLFKCLYRLHVRCRKSLERGC